MTLRTLSLFALLAAFSAAASAGEVTYYKDVAPILQANCQGCHRPGEIGPMAFETYEQARPWAQAIKESVLLKRMPPWHADSDHSRHFKNDRSLSAEAIKTLTAWADSGAAAGDPADAPAKAAEFVPGWNIGKPDLIFEMAKEFEVQAEGEVEYQYHVIPSGFTEDTWVQASEIRPGNREVVHHIIVYVRPPNSDWMRAAQPGEFYVPKKGGEGRGERDFSVGYAPGAVPEMLPPGQARLIPAGSDFVLQLHYTPAGKVQTDKSGFGFVVAKEPPAERVRTLAVANNKFRIPPGADNHRVEATLEVDKPMTLTAFLPHMHLRGKAFEYRLVRSDGTKETLLSVPRYDFNWQLTYELAEPIHLEKGQVLEATAWYDNSPNNPANPDPSVEVRYGDQSWEEMMFGFFDAAFPVKNNNSSDD